MKTLSIRTKNITTPLVREYAIEWRIRNVLFVLVILSALSYGYFVSATIFHVIARKDIHAETAAVQSKVVAFEEEFFALNERVSPAYAAELGLVIPDAKYFVPRTVQYASAQGISGGF